MANEPVDTTKARDMVSFVGFVPADFLQFLLHQKPRAELKDSSGKLSALTPRADPSRVQRPYHLFLTILPSFVGILNVKGYADANLLDVIAEISIAHRLEEAGQRKFDCIRFVGTDSRNYYLSSVRYAADDVVIGVMLIPCSPH